MDSAQGRGSVSRLGQWHTLTPAGLFYVSPSGISTLASGEYAFRLFGITRTRHTAAPKAVSHCVIQLGLHARSHPVGILVTFIVLWIMFIWSYTAVSLVFSLVGLTTDGQDHSHSTRLCARC
jgi:hypothetical protein